MTTTISLFLLDKNNREGEKKKENKTTCEYFFRCKPGILRAQLFRLIPRALWDSNGRQTLPSPFGAHDRIEMRYAKELDNDKIG